METIETSSSEVDLLALDQQLCFALAVASRSVISAYKPILDPLGVTHSQYLVMLALWEKEPRSLSELADVLRLEPATLSPLLKRLEAAGLVTRQRSASDERSLAVRLTETGASLRAAATQVPPQVVAALGVDIDELVELRTRLTAIVERIAPRSSPPSEPSSAERA